MAIKIAGRINIFSISHPNTNHLFNVIGITNSAPSIIVDYLTQSRARMGLSESLTKDTEIAELLLLIAKDHFKNESNVCCAIGTKMV